MVVDQRRMTLFYILIALHFPAGKKKKKKNEYTTGNADVAKSSLLSEFL